MASCQCPVLNTLADLRERREHAVPSARVLGRARDPPRQLRLLAFEASALEASALEASALSASAFSKKALSGSACDISPAPCSGTSFGASTLADDPSGGPSMDDPCIETAVGSPCPTDEWGATGPTKPVSPLIGSAFCSFTSKSPLKVDYLVTFIACEIVTGRGLTKILGSRPARFCPLTGAAAVLTLPMVPCGMVLTAPMCLRGRISRLTWRGPARRRGAP